MMEFTYDGIVRQGFGFYNPNHAAALICALLPFCWAGLLRWKHPAARAGFAAATLVLTIALALTFSRSGLLIFFAELLLFGLLTGRRSWKVVPWIAAGGVLLFLAAGVWGRFVLDRAVTNRFDIWLAGASLFAANPWLGVGHGNSGTLATAFLLRDGIVCRTLVNSHLTLFAEYGLFPGLLWAGGIAYALIAGWRRQRRAAWVSFAGMCMAAGVSLLLLASACSKKEKVSLQTATVTRGEITEAVTATGTLECITQVDVGTQVTGIVAKLFADFNSVVTEGQLIAEIDKTTLEADLQSADAQLESSRLEYEYAKKNYERDEALHQKQLISDYDYETSRRDYLVAKSDYERMQANRVSAARNLSYAEITSPMDGIVISREVEIGQTVVSNMEVANLFTIGDLDKMQVVADVDEADIGSVKVGQNAQFTVDAFPDDIFYGRVTQVRISPTTDTNVTTYEVLISTSNPDHKLIPGLTANVTINVMEEKDVMMLPIKVLRFSPMQFEGAEGLPVAEQMPESPAGKPSGGEIPDPLVTTDDNRRLVWVLTDDNRLVPTEIEMGVENGINVEIKSGLNEGDKVALQYTTEMLEEEAPQGERNPFMPGPPDRDKKKKNKGGE